MGLEYCCAGCTVLKTPPCCCLLVLLQVLEHIARVGQASDGPGQVCRWLTDVLTMFAGDTVPADEEAVRFVLSFASSLADPGLGVAPSIQAMPSLASLVPHYSVRRDAGTPTQLMHGSPWVMLFMVLGGWGPLGWA